MNNFVVFLRVGNVDDDQKDLALGKFFLADAIDLSQESGPLFQRCVIPHIDVTDTIAVKRDNVGLGKIHQLCPNHFSGELYDLKLRRIVEVTPGDCVTVNKMSRISRTE